jgi:hypothetical protein
MGWTYTTKPTNLSPIEFITTRNWSETYMTEKGYSFAATAQVGSTVYLALRIAKPDEGDLRTFEPAADGSVTTALVYLTKGGNGAPFGWRDMDESMGPYDAGRCPAALLAKLSPLKDGAGGFAKEWRGRQKASAVIGQVELI